MQFDSAGALRLGFPQGPTSCLDHLAVVFLHGTLLVLRRGVNVLVNAARGSVSKQRGKCNEIDSGLGDASSKRVPKVIWYEVDYDRMHLKPVAILAERVLRGLQRTSADR